MYFSYTLSNSKKDSLIFVNNTKDTITLFKVRNFATNETYINTCGGFLSGEKCGCNNQLSQHYTSKDQKHQLSYSVTSRYSPDQEEKITSLIISTNNWFHKFPRLGEYETQSSYLDSLNNNGDLDIESSKNYYYDGKHINKLKIKKNKGIIAFWIDNDAFKLQ